MGIGGGIFLIVVGAILAFGLSPDTWEVFNINTIGYILMVVGVLALVLAFAMQRQRRNTSHAEYIERRDIGNPPPGGPPPARRAPRPYPAPGPGGGVRRTCTPRCPPLAFVPWLAPGSPPTSRTRSTAG